MLFAIYVITAIWSVDVWKVLIFGFKIIDIFQCITYGKHVKSTYYISSIIQINTNFFSGSSFLITFPVGLYNVYRYVLKSIFTNSVHIFKIG